MRKGDEKVYRAWNWDNTQGFREQPTLANQKHVIQTHKTSNFNTVNS